MRQRERRQPGLAADGPQLVGRHELVGRVQRAKVHFDFVVAAAEHGRAAARAEVAAGVLARLAFDRHHVRGKDRGSVEQRAVVLAAIKTVADADAVRAARDRDPDIAAQATAGESIHFRLPPAEINLTLSKGQ